MRFEGEGNVMVCYDALVVGGGIAGAALATELAIAGRSVILFERESVPHDKVCGEFISGEGRQYLARLGISLDALGSLPIRHVRLARNSHAISAPLPFPALSLSRRILDEALLQRAGDAGVEIRRGVRVKELVQEGGFWIAALEDGERIVGRDAFLATGKHDLRGWKRPAGAQPDLIGFKCYWRLRGDQAKDIASSVELNLFPGGYAGLQPVEGGRANLCLLVHKRVFSERYLTWEGLLAGIRAASPHLRMRLEGAEPCMSRPLAISGLPYGYVGRQTDGPWRLGDQAAVIPSFSGDGMSIALHSARLAAQFYLAGQASAFYQRRLARDISAQVWRATAISKLLVSSRGQFAAMGFARAMPWVTPLLAGLTRIPDRAMQVQTGQALEPA
jgi:flavin-dependent dehydrogenase